MRRAGGAAFLRINRLQLYDGGLVMNGAGYCMGVWRECQADIGLYNGEVDDDVDENGYKIDIDETIEPEDIKVGDRENVLLSTWPNYECPERHRDWLQLLFCPPEEISMYQFPYRNMKMYQLMKRLLTIFFGNRNGEWTVKNMSIQNNVLRWPVHTRKPIVQEFNIGEYSQLKMNCLDSIIDSSVPLTNLQMNVPASHDRIVDHPMFLHADHVTISNQPLEIVFSDLFLFQANTVVIANPPSAHFLYFEKIIFVFMEKTRPIGVRWSILIYAKKDLTTLVLPDALDVIEISRDCMKLAMGSDAIVVLQFSETHSGTWFNIETCPRISKNP